MEVLCDIVTAVFLDIVDGHELPSVVLSALNNERDVTALRGTCIVPGWREM